MPDMQQLPPLLGALGLACAFVIYLLLTRRPEGEGKVVKIAAAIHLGAMVFMKREYIMLALFAAVLIALLCYLPRRQYRAGLPRRRRLLGAGGLDRHVRRDQGERAHHHRRAQARRRGRASVAFYGGSIMGLMRRLAGAARPRFPVPAVRRRPAHRACDPRLRHGRLDRRAVLAGRRRHLHQERRRGRGPGRQARSGHPRGRPAQSRA